ncbi:hypothetical protein L249_1408 [Ophiocordyceps polyrhachis-furcata BCC 54312]|uniref:ELYS-like domain-containing protein n=1 Tax=Ophiocordyceps polyrhachis-furcata BCC 54312 TaxID=1330021 RepID=A0A367L4A4_9HYPO|nr:hypothetical protein L249_1408 [Ophiocordyceps polyrhachis-furcata BCC 54312]
MLMHSRYDDVFHAKLKFPYDRTLQHEIEHHRKAQGGLLFIDRVMKALGVVKGSSSSVIDLSVGSQLTALEGRMYPPKSENALRQLHQLFCETAMAVHHKQSLLYYIMLDFDTVASQSSESQKFAADVGMPVNYQTFMKGLWLMDRQRYQEALEFVTHPSLTPDFADDIITTLVRYAPDHDYSLVLSYFYTVRPSLKSASALELLFDAMVQADATEALLFSRTHPQHTRQQLFRRWVRINLKQGRRGEQPSQRDRLAFLPLDSVEEKWFEQYLTVGEGKNLPKAKDTLLARQIACDRFSDVSEEQKVDERWAAVVEGIKRGVGATHSW